MVSSLPLRSSPRKHGPSSSFVHGPGFPLARESAEIAATALMPPALHRPFELRSRVILGPHGLVLLALQLDQIGRRERVLPALVEPHAAIADHQLVRFQIG